MKNILVLTSAGQIGLAIARRIGTGMKIVVSDNSASNAASAALLLNNAGFDAVELSCDISSKESVAELIKFAKNLGPITAFVNAAGVSPSQASIETILEVDLYGTAMLLEEIGKVIEPNGVAVTISSQSGHRMPALGEEKDRLLATTPVEELLSLDFLQPKNISNTLHAYQLAKRCNVKRVMAEAVKWGTKKARINSISPGIIVTPLAIDEFNGPRGGFYKEMFAKCPAGRPGTADEVADLAQLIMDPRSSFITGSDFLIDGGALPPTSTLRYSLSTEPFFKIRRIAQKNLFLYNRISCVPV